MGPNHGTMWLKSIRDIDVLEKAHNACAEWQEKNRTLTVHLNLKGAVCRI